MTMESDLITFLKNDADVAAIVVARVFPLIVPQSQSVPAIRINLITHESEVDLGGVTGEARATVQIDNYANTFDTTVDLAEKVRVALVADNNGARTMGSTVVSQTKLTGKTDEPPFPEPGKSSRNRFNRSLDFELDYTEAAPA